MVDLGYTKISNGVIQGPFDKGSPLLAHLNVGVAANMYPGRLVRREATDYDIQVGSIAEAKGWLGYQHASSKAKPTNRDTLYALDVPAPVHYGGGFRVRSSLAAGFSVNRNDLLANWVNGEVMGPVQQVGYGGLALKIPFTKSITEHDTGIDLPANMMVIDAFVEVITNAAAATIDVGLLSTETGGDADGFLDGASLAAAGMVTPSNRNTVSGAEILGNLLGEEIKSGDTTPYYALMRKGHVCDGTAKSISYTTSDHTVAGNIWLVLSYPGFRVVAEADESVNASAAAAALWAHSLI